MSIVDRFIYQHCLYIYNSVLDFTKFNLNCAFNTDCMPSSHSVARMWISDIAEFSLSHRCHAW